MVDAIALDRVLQRSHHVLLADDLVERQGAVAAVERGLAGHPPESRLRLVTDRNLLDHGRRIAELERKVSELYERLGQAEPGFESGGLTFASDQAESEGAAGDPRLLEFIDAGNEIQAIKLYRELTGVGLAEAKDAVEQLATTYGSGG